MKKYFYLILIAVAALSTSCKHHSSGASAIDLVKDSVFLYSQEDYYWYDALPTYDAFNPRSYVGSSDQAGLTSEVDAISQFKINPATGNPYEYVSNYPGEAKYSFIDQGQVSTLLSGTNSDFGFFPAYGALSNTDLRIMYVDPNSPAAKAGMHRGDLITAITGVAGLDGTSDTNIAAINAALSANTIGMTLKRNNGTTYTANLTVTNYTINPVMKDTVITTSNGKKVGYMVLSVFTELTNAQPQLDLAFNYFISQNITDLVVDLRYNGGGATETAEYIDNLVVPPAKNNTTMYISYFNAKLQNNQFPLLSQIYAINPGDFSVANNTAVFSKQKTLNISRVMFIVTGNTASASEFTINNLRPEMDVRLVGTTTYGKPVGFFAIPINIYQLYVPEFEVKNSAGQGGYYTGMTPATTDYPGYIASDDVDHDFGDPSENMLSHCLSYINVGTYSISQPQIDALSGANTLSIAQQQNLNSHFHRPALNGVMLFSKKGKFRRKR